MSKPLAQRQHVEDHSQARSRKLYVGLRRVSALMNGFIYLIKTKTVNQSYSFFMT